MSTSANLSYFLDRLQSFSTNYFRLESDNQSTATAGQIVSISLPDNAILNLSSFKVLCNVSTSGGTAGARLVPIDNLVEKIEINCGGSVISQGSNFTNVLLDAMVKMGQKSCDTAMGHPEIVREKAYDYNGITPLTTTSNEDYGDFPFTNFCMSNFLGFIDSCQPRLIDLSLLPSLKVRLTLAPNNVLPSVESAALSTGQVFTTRNIDVTTSHSFQIPGNTANSGFSGGTVLNTNAGNAKYTVSNIHAMIEACGLASEIYDQTIAAMMQQQGFIEIPFKNYQSFQDVHSGSSRFTVSSASVDRIWTIWRASNYNTNQKPIPIDGYKSKAAFAVDGSSDANPGKVVNIGQGDYDSGGVFDTNKEKYTSAFFNYKAPFDIGDVAKATVEQQLQLNSAYMPNFPANFGDILQITKNSLPMQGMDYLKNMTMSQYLHNYCIGCYRLNLPGSENLRVLSGLDARNSNIQGIVKTTGTTDNPVLNIYTETTSVLRCGVGRAVELIS